MDEKGIRVGMCQAVYRYAKANNKCMKNYDKNIKSSYIEYVDANNLYGGEMSQKLPVNGFKWVEENNLSTFNESFIKNYDETMIRDIFLKQMLNILKNYLTFTKIYDSYQKEKKIINAKRLFVVQKTKKYMLFV